MNFLRRRERVLIGILLGSLSWYLASTHDENTAESPNSRQSIEKLAEQMSIARSRFVIADSLAARTVLWNSLRSRMIEHVPSASLVANYSSTLLNLANNCGIDMTQPLVTIDSSKRITRLHAHAILSGEPALVVEFFSELDSNPFEIWTSSVHLSRTSDVAPAQVKWAGTVDFESLVQPSKL